jgi:hypothetical protein
MMDNIEHYPTENYQNASDRGNHSYMEKKPFNCLDNHADWENVPQICIMQVPLT